jgi:hypothetical protein
MKFKLIFLLSIFSLVFTMHDAQSQSNVLGYNRLIGSWVRADGGYILEIKDVHEDGKLNAAYFNPRPIKISEARASKQSERINIFVELRDKGYPGSYYTLVYAPENDRLVGRYHHLGINQKFDIFFVRK